MKSIRLYSLQTQSSAASMTWAWYPWHASDDHLRTHTHTHKPLPPVDHDRLAGIESRNSPRRRQNFPTNVPSDRPARRPTAGYCVEISHNKARPTYFFAHPVTISASRASRACDGRHRRKPARQLPRHIVRAQWTIADVCCVGPRGRGGGLDKLPTLSSHDRRPLWVETLVLAGSSISLVSSRAYC